MSSITAKSLHPIPHVADLILGGERAVVNFTGSAPVPVSERVARALLRKRDNLGQPMYEVTGLDPAPKPTKEVHHAGNQ